MDDCHLLFERLWLFDRKVINDDYKNTCTFHKDGIKVTLEPSRNEMASKPYKEEENIFLSTANFELEVEEVCQAYAFLMMKSNSNGSLLTEKIVSFAGISRYYF